MSSKDLVKEIYEDSIISGPILNVRGTVRYFGLRTVSIELLLNG